MDCSLLGSSVHGISQEEYWNGLPFPTLGVLPHPGIESVSPALAGRFLITVPSRHPQDFFMKCHVTTVWSDRFIQDYFEDVFVCLFFVFLFLFFFFLILSGFLIFFGVWNQFIFRGVTLQFADPQWTYFVV